MNTSLLLLLLVAIPLIAAKHIHQIDDGTGFNQLTNPDEYIKEYYLYRRNLPTGDREEFTIDPFDQENQISVAYGDERILMSAKIDLEPEEGKYRRRLSNVDYDSAFIGRTLGRDAIDLNRRQISDDSGDERNVIRHKQMKRRHKPRKEDKGQRIVLDG